MKSLNNKKHFTASKRKEKLFNTMGKAEELRYKNGYANLTNQPFSEFIPYNHLG